MRKIRFTEHQIIAVLKSVEAGSNVAIRLLIRHVAKTTPTAMPKVVPHNFAKKDDLLSILTETQIHIDLAPVGRA